MTYGKCARWNPNGLAGKGCSLELSVTGFHAFPLSESPLSETPKTVWPRFTSGQRDRQGPTLAPTGPGGGWQTLSNVRCDVTSCLQGGSWAEGGELRVHVICWWRPLCPGFAGGTSLDVTQRLLIQSKDKGRVASISYCPVANHLQSQLLTARASPSRAPASGGSARDCWGLGSSAPGGLPPGAGTRVQPGTGRGTSGLMGTSQASSG